MNKVKEKFVKIFKADFLVGENSLRNWIAIIFTIFLCIVMIYSGHLIDQKVHTIAKLGEEVKELRSEFVDVRSRLQRIKLESTVLSTLKDTGLKQSQTPPNKIKVIIKE
ncbi:MULTISPECIES: FtsL-like putative cell division protein [unclassified Capnocytophaga]|jgi:secreted protein|uniref:FtsL-like putative cell division protein n=1 Tax=unclassified Capnocytophaga TaxID=2640652 RepID=UPI000202F49A|nr:MULTISPECIES: FtsL-like putative cell division protein [unclassified Capnocytophaga]EGD34731.1 S-adenosyl-methyltransferase MraW [Capnocytophaga sp. oral taxon 338 str. F0234]MEB3004689.1 FtsL-like putative cell division protein [Capnocytophaga sp. G2]